MRILEIKISPYFKKRTYIHKDKTSKITIFVLEKITIEQEAKINAFLETL